MYFKYAVVKLLYKIELLTGSYLIENFFLS